MTTKTVEWKTAITNIEPNKVTIHGYPIDQLMGSISYADAVYLLLKGELPGKNIGKMMDAMLVSSVDHGVTPPSTLSALTCASTGANISQALACGILSINQFHGGAIQNCQKIILEAVALKESKGLSTDEAAEELVSDYMANKKTLFGLGHRIHTKDPRTAKLFQIAHELGIEGKYVEMLRGIEKAFEKIKGKSLPVNVDGAIASLLCEMGFDPELGNAFFMMARIPGLLAHIQEEKKRQKPMRRINPNEYEYDGPEEKQV